MPSAVAVFLFAPFGLLRIAAGVASCAATLAPPRADVMPPLEGVVRVSAGGAHTCALVAGGQMKCWGGNGAGELGDGTTTQRTLPVTVRGLGPVIDISAGAEYTCAVTAAGGVMCWGLNHDGQIGNGQGGFGVVQRMPAPVSGLGGGVVAVSTGTEHTYALTAAGGVKCWGRNHAGQLGDGTTTDRYTPVDVIGLTHGAGAIAAGGGETVGHTCAVTAGGGLRCWGRNNDGQLGDGGIADRHTPVNVQGHASGVAAVALGDRHTCARSTAGRIACWGNNGWNHLGATGFTEPYSSTPLDVNGLVSGAASLGVRVDMGCAVVAGQPRCWGVFHFPLGNILPVFSMSPVDQGPAGTAAISVGGAGWSLEAHTCALTADTRLRCWGGNRAGQLGNGATAGYDETPRLVLAGAGIFGSGFEN